MYSRSEESAISIAESREECGAEQGYMAGGNTLDIERLMPVFDALRPLGDRRDSFVHAGPTGAGHYAKMVHNGIEPELFVR